MDVHIPVKQKNYDEFFTHLEVCKQRSKNFISRQSELKRIRSLLQKSVFTQPLVIYGDQEVGKSSFVAKIVEEAHKSDWLGIDGVVAVRYVGLTRESGDIEGLLRSIFAQVAAAYHVCASLPQSLSRAGFRSKFSALLKSMLSNPLLKQVRPCLILIDGINHLPPQDQADLFEWIPSRLPPDVYLILTVSTKDNEVPEWLKSQEVDLMQLTPLTADQLNGLIPVILKQQNRTLTSSQLDMVKASIETCTSPLYTELVTHQASNWTSFDTDIKVPSTVEQAINQLFDRLELEYGEKLTRYVSSYLTLCKYGITENELDDVLSCTDDLLIDVYVYHAPPVPGVVRIPSHLVPMLRSQLNVYFLERKSTDLVTVIWAYRQFSDVVKKRYLSDPKQKEKCLNAIIEIFSAFNGVRRTITLSKLRNPITVENANRQIISPKLDKMTTRSLFIMAYHLAGLEKLDSFKELVAFNLEYLKAVWKKDSLKMISGLKLTLSDEELKKFSSDAELAQMRAFHSLYWLLGQEKYSDAVFADFCTHLIGYFKANPSTPHINKLLEQAEDTLRNAKCPILIEPHQSCLYSSTDYVRWLASGYNRPCTGDSDEINAVCSSSGDRVHVIDTLDNFTYSVNLPKSTTRAHIAKKKLFTISGSSAHVVALEEGNQVKGQISKNAKSKSSTTLRQLHVSKSSQLVVTADNSVVSVYKAKPLKESNKPNYQESGVLTLSGINSVDAVLTTSDEKYVVIAATISANKRVFGGITTWDYTKSGTSSRIGLPKPVLSGHMYCLPDNDRLICVTGPTEVIMVSLTQQKIMEQIYSDSIPWIDLCVYEEFCALAFDDGTCVVWDFSSTNKASLQPSAPPSCVSIFGGRILVGTVHGDIEFYSLKTFKLLITIKISHTSITALKEATAGALMALDKQENAYLFDIESLVKASQKPGSDVKYQLEPSVNGMLSTDASTLLVERPEGLPVSLYGTDNLTRVDVSASAGYTRAVLCCGQSYIVGIKSSCLAVWDLTKGQEVIPSVHADVLQSIDCFSASVDTDLVLAAGNGNLIEWRPGENNVVKTEASYTSETRAIKVSFNQDSILLCTSESKGSYSCHVIGKNDKQPVMRVELPSLSSGPFYTDKHVYYVKDGQLHETNTGPLAKKLGISDVRLVSCCPSSAAVVSSKREIFLIKQNDKMACLQLDGIGHVCDLIHLNDAYTVVVGELGTIWLVNWGKQRQAISNKVVTRLGCLKAKLSDDSKKLYVYGQLLQETRLLILDVSKPL